MRKLRKDCRPIKKTGKEMMMPLVVAVTICMLIIILGVAEYMRLVITAAGIKGCNGVCRPYPQLMTIITRFTIVSGKDMPQAMSRMGGIVFLPSVDYGDIYSRMCFYSDWKRTGRDMFESITEERWSTV